MSTPALLPAFPAVRSVALHLQLRLVLLAAALLACCFPALVLLVRTWSAQDKYSYGFLVPPITLFWIWHDRSALARLAATPAPAPGAAVAAAAGLMLFAGRMSSTAAVQELALPVLLAGLILLLLGAGFLRRVALPLSYLALMVPVLDLAAERLHWPFQLFAAATAENLLRLAAVPVHRSAQFLELPRLTLEVAEACSGVRYLVSTLVLCVPLVFITQKTRARRLLLFLLGLAIGIAANPVRVTLIGLWAHYAGGDVHGPSHLLQGYAVYLMGMAAVFAGAWVMQASPGPEPGPAAGGPEARSPRELHPFNQAWLLAFGGLVLLALLLHLGTARPVPLKNDLDKLQVRIAGLHAADCGPASPGPAGPQHACSYTTPSGRQMTLLIRYVEAQSADRKLVVPMPRLVREEVTINAHAGRAVRVSKTLAPAGDREELTLFWYRVNGRTLADPLLARWANAVDGVLRFRNNGALIMLSCAATASERADAQRELVEFAGALLPLLDEYLP